MENNFKIPNEIKTFICKNKCFMNYTITCNPDSCYIINKYAKEIMNNCNCFNSINTKAEDSNTEKAITALGILAVINEINKKSDIIKELQTENSKLKEENVAFKKENKLLDERFKLSEELRNNSSEKKIIELQEDKRELQYKIQDLEYDLTKQTQLNIYLVNLLKNNEK